MYKNAPLDKSSDDDDEDDDDDDDDDGMKHYLALCHIAWHAWCFYQFTVIT